MGGGGVTLTNFNFQGEIQIVDVKIKQHVFDLNKVKIEKEEWWWWRGREAY